MTPQPLAFSGHEFADRIARTQKIMQSGDMPFDALLVFSTECEPAGVRYYADYWPSFETAGVLIPRKGDPALLIGPESLNFASANSRIGRIVRMQDFRESSQPAYPGSKFATWAEVLGEYNVKTLGIAGWHMFPHAILRNIADVIGLPAITDADAVVREVTRRKTPAEQACLKRAAEFSELGFKAVLESIRPEMTEIQLVAIATAAMLDAGAEATGYPIWCCSGPNSIQAISRPTHRRVGEGEIIHFSIGAKVQGYSASIGRPVVLGHCPPETRRFLQAGLDAQNHTISLMRAGTRAADVASQIHRLIADAGFGHTILYGPAHGCGQMECEYPFVETSSTFTLEEGMTFMVDIFLANETMGFRWEDGIIVQNGPAMELSSYRRQINIIEV